jgi:hypothetical protein
MKIFLSDYQIDMRHSDVKYGLSLELLLARTKPVDQWRFAYWP